jgi:hypothetical protein
MPFRLRAIVLMAAMAAGVMSATACHSVDLAKNLTIAPGLSGYYDAGLLDGWAHLLPTISFKVKDTGTQSVSAGVRLTVSFWFVGDADGENDSIVLPGLEKTLNPGDETTTFTAQAPHGFRLEGARADLFQHSSFRDMLAKVFVESHGTIYRLGEFPIDHLIIPHASSGRP